MNRNENFEDLATAQVGRAQSRRTRLAPLGGGIKAGISGRNIWTGKPPCYEANLNNYTVVPQSDPMNCKNATLEAIEKMNGGTRTQADFKKLGEAFLRENPDATLEEYFEHFGFDVKDPVIRFKTVYQYGASLENGYPIVATEKISDNLDHTLTLIRIRQWTSTSRIKVWFGDPALGIWKANWNIFYTPSFQNSQGLFLFHLKN